MAAFARMTTARRCFDNLFDFCEGFTYARLDYERVDAAQRAWPRVSEDTEAYIASTPSLSTLSVRLLLGNAAFEGPLYPLFREYLWGQVCGVPMRQPFNHLDELLNAIAQLRWRGCLTAVCIHLNEEELETEARCTRSEYAHLRWWNADVHARFYGCVREFRTQCLHFIDLLDQLEGDPRPDAATLLLRRDAFLAGRERPQERRWALAALGIGRAARAPPYISDVDTDVEMSDASDAS
jgi:hypothetical protein